MRLKRCHLQDYKSQVLSTPIHESVNDVIVIMVSSHEESSNPSEGLDMKRIPSDMSDDTSLPSAFLNSESFPNAKLLSKLSYTYNCSITSITYLPKSNEAQVLIFNFSIFFPPRVTLKFSRENTAYLPGESRKTCMIRALKNYYLFPLTLPNWRYTFSLLSRFFIVFIYKRAVYTIRVVNFCIIIFSTFVSVYFFFICRSLFVHYFQNIAVVVTLILVHTYDRCTIWDACVSDLL